MTTWTEIPFAVVPLTLWDGNTTIWDDGGTGWDEGTAIWTEIAEAT